MQERGTYKLPPVALLFFFFHCSFPGVRVCVMLGIEPWATKLPCLPLSVETWSVFPDRPGTCNPLALAAASGVAPLPGLSLFFYFFGGGRGSKYQNKALRKCELL